MTAASASGRLTIYERAADLPQAWDTARRSGDLSLDRRFIETSQRFALACGQKRYVVYESTAGTAIATAELLPRNNAANPVRSVLLGRADRRLPGARYWLPPMLLLDADLSSDPPVATAPAREDGFGRFLDEMLAALEHESSRRGWSLAVAGVRAAETAFGEALRRRGFLHTVGRPFAELRLGYGSWDAFLRAAAGRNKAAARNIRYEVNRARRDGIAIVEWDPARVTETELHALVDAHCRRLNEREFEHGSGFLSALKEALGDDMRILVAMREQRVQGVVVLIRQGRRGYVLYAGMVGKNDRAGLAYFNLVFYRPIQIAIELGLENLAYGNGAFEAKIRRGCTVTDTSLFFRPRHGIVRAALKGPLALHARLLHRKYAPILEAPAFSSVR